MSKKNKIFSFMYKHMFLTIILGVLLVGAICFAFSSVIKGLKSHRNYELSFSQDEFVFDCNSSDGSECTPRIISGDFSKYDDIIVAHDDIHECSINSDKFECEMYGHLTLSDYYKTKEFDATLLPDSFETTMKVSIIEKTDDLILHKGETYLSKNITIRFNLSDTDKRLIANRQKTWLAEQESSSTSDNNSSSNTDNSSNTPSTNSADSSQTTNTGWKETLDTYEKWVDSYVAFMKKYKNANSSDMASMMGDYSKMTQELVEWSDKVDKLDDNLSSDDLKYYLEVTSRCTQKMAEITN
ncbi:MAG: DUF6591 domain-containing protein [Candidatus Nanosyncoccaceae bacterium]